MQRQKQIEILRLKIILQDVKDAESESRAGSLELTSVLENFRERISADQLSKFNKFFFGASKPESESRAASGSTDIVPQQEFSQPNSEYIKKQDDPAWFKKIYKQIVSRTHPDKFIDFPVKEIKDKYKNIYIDAVKAYESQNIGVILICAYDCEIDITHIDEAQKYILESYASAESKIKYITSLLGYQWFHLDESNKLTTLENYLRQLGYKFNKEKAEKAIREASRKIRKRKPGQRPDNLIRVKRKQIK